MFMCEISFTDLETGTKDVYWDGFVGKDKERLIKKAKEAIYSRHNDPDIHFEEGCDDDHYCLIFEGNRYPRKVMGIHIREIEEVV